MSRLNWLLVSLALLFSMPTQGQDEATESLRESGRAFAAVARQVSPAVVFIQVESTSTGGYTQQSPFFSPFDDDFFRRFFDDTFPRTPDRQDRAPSRRIVSQGSGFVFSTRQGLLRDTTYLLTNNHVVEGADKIRVTFLDGREFEAEITGTDPESDVAVIEIHSGDLPSLELGDSSAIEIGEWVVAIGNPFGLSHTLTVGVVSALGRTSLGITDYEDFIQTDAAINPGNSGGPLVNLDGEVIGMNSAIFSRSGGYMGVGFAIPSNLVAGIAEQLIDTGEVVRGYLGIVIQPLTADLAKSFDVEPGHGILVAQVSEDSPAQRAGLQPGDIIVAYQGMPVTDVGAFRNRVSLTVPDSSEQLTIIREGRQQEISIVIGTLSEGQMVAQDGAGSSAELGLSVQTLTPQLAEQFNTQPGQGVVVTRVEAGSIAALSAIQVGTVILEVNRTPVDSAATFNRLIEASSAERRVLLLLRSSEGQRYVVLNWQ